jgi:hypothetical protein
MEARSWTDDREGGEMRPALANSADVEKKRQ